MRRHRTLRASTPWTPWNIPQLVGYVDFRQYASAASVVDLVTGSAFTAVGGVTIGTGANGQAAAIFDGVDDCFLLTGVPASWPTGAAVGWMFAVVNQVALAADTGGRAAFSYGAANSTTRSLRRGVPSGVNRARASTGNGTSLIDGTNDAIDFSGRHVMFGAISATASRCDVDGTAGTATAVVPATATARVRIGASSGTTAANFWNGDITCVLVGTGTLSATDLARLNHWGSIFV